MPITEPVLPPGELAESLASLPDWSLESGGKGIVRTLDFGSFSKAWAFLSRVALLAERSRHHPDWENSYGKVRIVLTSHDVGGISARDIRFARKIEKILDPSS